VGRAGWGLTYSDARNEHFKLLEAGEARRVDATASIGLRIRVDGTVQDAVPGSPAYRAGAGPGMRVISVNGRRWSPDVLRNALSAAKTTKDGITLQVDNNDVVSTLKVEYDEGQREPHLQRDPSTANLLDQILAPRIAAAPR
jgi:predicted metalloprotease with PDZ domain